MPDYQFILAPKLCEIGAQYSVSKLANASAACVLVLLHVFHVFLHALHVYSHVLHVLISMSCMCSSACPACVT